jgi:type II secretory pathway component PulC
MSFFKAFSILVLFLAISLGMLSTIQGDQEKAKLIISDETAPKPQSTPVVAKDDATTKTPTLKISAIMYSKDSKRRMALIGGEIFKIGDKPIKNLDSVITDIKPNSVMIKSKGREEEVFLEK